MNSLTRLYKGEDKKEKQSSEIGVLKSVSPHFVFTINGVEYSSENFTVYVPAIERIKQWEDILGDDLEPGTAYKQKVTVDIGDLELEPDLYEQRFLIGDLLDITDRGDSFIVHGRLVKWDECRVTKPQPHRQR